MGELRVIEPLLAFVRQLPPTDLVAVYYPLDSMTDVHFARDREPVLEAIREFQGTARRLHADAAGRRRALASPARASSASAARSR